MRAGGVEALQRSVGGVGRSFSGRPHHQRKEHIEMTTTRLWRYDDPTWAEIDLVGYEVEALDGEIGRIDEASQEIGTRYLVVDTGPWIFGKKVMLPAGLVERVDLSNKRVHVGRTRDVIKRAPEFNEARHHDPRYREALAVYYGPSRAAMSRSSTDDGRVGSTF
jgi:hypothetical protein